MMPEQVAIVTRGIVELRPRMEEIADRFYTLLFDRHPELRELFPSDISVQRRKFADELELIVRAIPDFGSFVARARHLGARHAGYGVRVASYARVRAVLFEVIGAALGDGCTAEAEEAWHSAYNLITEAMLLGGAPPAGQVSLRSRR